MEMEMERGKTATKEIDRTVRMIRNVHLKICDLMDKGIIEDGSADICSLDEIINELESQK